MNDINHFSPNDARYDLIGDIHGHHAKLTSLLQALGYRPRQDDGFSGWQHPEGRRVIFLGDYIDRGPASREVLRLVRGMVDAGDAEAIMGNHEYNAVCWHTPDGSGGWLRPHRPERDGAMMETLRQFSGLEDEWQEWLQWFRGLPMFLEIDGLRAVHACWDARCIARLKGESLLDDDFLRRSTVPCSSEHRAVENVLKGPEMALPDGQQYEDKDGTTRYRIRARWWDLPQEAAAIGPLAMPEPLPIDSIAPKWEIGRLPNYAADQPPVFFGHYWRPPSSPKAPYAPNLVCLDYSGAHGDNPLVAYRWEGEQELVAEHFAQSPPPQSEPESFELFVDDNFHYMDEDERYRSGVFGDYEAAVATAKKIVDDYLLDAYEPGKTAGELYSSYTMFGEDPWIRPTPEGTKRFSAWDYGKQRAEEIAKPAQAKGL